MEPHQLIQIEPPQLSGFLRDIWTDPVLYPSLTKSWCLTWLFGTSNPTNIKIWLVFDLFWLKL
ncbi:hypothetical protein HanIR_Chr04g0186211 [Helianthus annuus]|nr:hypothetical protein HanIR_Chr04g0186211 [Helianthus annuus]